MVLVAALALLPACSEPTGPNAPTLQFVTRVVFGFPTLATTAEARDRAIVVSGILLAPHSGYTVAGVMLVDPGRLTLTVSGTQTSAGIPFPTQNYYAATIEHLNPGTYALLVRQIIERDAIDTTVVFDQNVTVH